MARGAATRLASLARACAQRSSLEPSSRGIYTTQKGSKAFEVAKSSDQARQAASQLSHTRSALTAVQTATQTAQEVRVLPQISTDLYGAVSAVIEGETVEQGVYRNEDGHRFEDGRYKAFTEEISAFVPASRQFSDPVRTFAYGTDASFYRLNPKLVVKVHTEGEIRRILPIAAKHGVPVTFRAAGTSLSGQAITDSVLLKLSHTGKNFRNFTIHGDGSTITLEPGLIGGEVNRILATHKVKGKHPIQYKIGPDPSSIDSCMMGGIVANNSSGMCCGVSQNTYHTLKDMRIVFVDGTVLDTGDLMSREAFMKSHRQLVEGVTSLARRVQADRELTNLIRRKYAIKNTTGYSLNALVDFPADNPIEVIKHLMIGSEGTLGFVSQATYNTVPEWPNKASSFMVFPDVRAACQAAAVLRNNTSVDAVELFDRPSLYQCEVHEDIKKLLPGIVGADPMAAALLIECRGQTAAELQERIAEVHRALRKSNLPLGGKASVPETLEDFPFHEDPKVYTVFWDVRKGLIPIVGAARETGTSMLIEDVACPVDNLAGMMIDLVEMFQRHGYHDASCFGHALEGNLHLVFSQGFRTPEEVARFGSMMDEMADIVATKHGGSLKGEHSTGRNMAPYVEMEWGSKAYSLMWELKALFDPLSVLNPGVILNRDPALHLKSLKSSPAASEIVDRCIECGFCESNCPSRDLTLTPRQRITTYREMARLEGLASPSAEEQQRLADFRKSYVYDGESTCAADGMCQEKCPVKINTGDLIKSIRAEQTKEDKRTSAVATWLAGHFNYLNSGVPALLNTVNVFHSILGPKPLEIISGLLNRVSNHAIPVWNRYLPKGASALREPKPAPASEARAIPRKVVYAVSCVTRMMGPAAGDSSNESLHEKMMNLFEKAGYEVIFPKGLSSSCCGMMFNSRGFKDAAAAKGAELEAALMEASEGGKIPIVVDTSPCLAQIKAGISEPALRFALYEPVEFVRHFLVDKLDFHKVRDSVAVHVPCSSKKMGIESAFAQLAGLCSHEVVNTGVPCCGMAGDRGMRFPELTDASLQHLNLPASVTEGYSTSRTCEMNLASHAGIEFKGLVYLLDEASTPKKAASASA